MPSHVCVCVRVARVYGCVPLAPPPCGGMGLETHARRCPLGHRFLYVYIYIQDAVGTPF